jgi:hypothetical protein
VLPLADIIAIDVVPGDPCCFSIRCPPIHLTVAAASTMERENWMVQLEFRVTAWRSFQAAKVTTAKLWRGRMSPLLGDHLSPEPEVSLLTETVATASLPRETTADVPVVPRNAAVMMAAPAMDDHSDVTCEANDGDLCDSLSDAVVPFELSSEEEEQDEDDQKKRRDAAINRDWRATRLPSRVRECWRSGDSNGSIWGLGAAIDALYEANDPRG